MNNILQYIPDIHHPMSFAYIQAQPFYQFVVHNEHLFMIDVCTFSAYGTASYAITQSLKWSRPIWDLAYNLIQVN